MKNALTRALLVAALSIVPVGAAAQSKSAPLVVTATVVSSCKVNVPSASSASALPTIPVAVACGRGVVPPRVQRPELARRIDTGAALVVINF
jgi:hypothetical protein